MGTYVYIYRPNGSTRATSALADTCLNPTLAAGAGSRGGFAAGAGVTLGAVRARRERIWIRNTSRHPDARVRRLVRFAVADVDMDRVCVNVKNGAMGGGAYNGVPEISNAPRDADYLVTLRLGNGRERWPLGPVNYHFKGPDETGPRNRFPFFVCHDWEEWLVKLAAHEAKHIEQFRNELSCSELSCERFAVEKLAEFRELRRPRENHRAARQLELAFDI